MNPIQAIVVDDVAESRKTLIRDIKDYCPEITILGEADGVVSAARLIRQVKPELIFLDIQMQDGSGFDLLDIIGEENIKVIFTTASDAFALKAFRYAALDYLLKPIDVEELINAVKKVSTQKFSQSEPVKLLNEQLKKPDDANFQRLALHTQDKIYIVEIAEILRCESDGNYTRFHLKDKSTLLVTRTLKDFDDLLTPMNFIRVHQSHLVNIVFVREFNKRDGGYLIMRDGSEVLVSTRKRAEVIDRLEGKK